MQQWKPWQIAFLFYLLALNCVILAALGYILLKNNVFAPPQTTPEQVIVLAPNSPPSVPPTATSTFIPTATLTPAPTPTPIPSVNVPPAPMPTETESKATEISQQVDTPTSTATPSPTDTPVSTATSTTTPTSTNTSAPTHTPSATAMSTHTPTSTSTSTPTPTRKSTSTPSPSATSTHTPTNTPVSTATSTAIPTATATATALPSPTAVLDQQNITPIAVAALSDTRTAVTVPANAAIPIDAIPLTNGSIALSWELVERARQYRVYSDMGTGYGVYIYKNHTAIQPAFVDELLRPGMTYQYRVSHLADDQEIMLGQAQVSTFVDKTATNTALTNPAITPSTKVTAQPTALPPDAVLLGLVSDHNFIDSFNTLTIVGEVRNDSPAEVDHTSITVTFYDAAGVIIDTAHGETMLESILAGDTAPFLITLSRPAGMASYSLRAVALPATAESKPQLYVTETRRFEDEAGFFHIKGSIKNVGSTTAKRIKVAAIIYGRDTRVINVNFAYVIPPNLAPGEQGTYDVIFTYYPAYFDQAVIPFEE